LVNESKTGSTGRDNNFDVYTGRLRALCTNRRDNYISSVLHQTVGMVEGHKVVPLYAAFFINLVLILSFKKIQTLANVLVFLKNKSRIKLMKNVAHNEALL
jgi:hypothetical protein